MKIAIIGKKYKNDLSDIISSVVKVLEQKDVKAIDLSYFETTVEEVKESPVDFYKKIENLMFKNDALIVEATQRSIGIGIIAGLALGLKKPVLLLYDISSREDMHLSTVADASASKHRSMVFGYTDEDSIQNGIEKFLEWAKEYIISKFFINLPSEQNRYLIWWSYKTGRPKVEKLRELLSSDLESNNEWRKLE